MNVVGNSLDEHLNFPMTIRHRWTHALAAVALVASVSPAAAQVLITSISVPVGSQNSDSRPYMDSVWSVTAPINLNSGIGIIANPTVTGVVFSDFALHENNAYGTSPPYSAANTPNPAMAKVTFQFNMPTTITGVRIVQHSNGVTSVSGALGNSPGSLVSLGNVFGPSGDLIGGTVVGTDATAQDFNLTSGATTGTIFELTITKTNHASAFAVYRIYLLDGNGAVIGAALTAVPEPATCGILAGLGALGLAMWRRRLRAGKGDQKRRSEGVRFKF